MAFYVPSVFVYPELKSSHRVRKKPYTPREASTTNLSCRHVKPYSQIMEITPDNNCYLSINGAVPHRCKQNHFQ